MLTDQNIEAELITLAPKKLILTRRASEGSASVPSLARRVSMCKDAKLSCRGNSYAYLHAVATRVGFSCEYRNQHPDGAGVDATVTEDGRMLANDSILTSFSVDVQLKATYRELPEQDGRISYSLTVPHYDKLRVEEVAAPRVCSS